MPRGSHFLQTQIREWEWVDPSVCVRVCGCLGEKRGEGQENKWDYWCYMSNIIAEIWAEEEESVGWWARWSVQCFIWAKGQQVTEFGLWPQVCDIVSEMSSASHLQQLLNFKYTHENTHLWLTCHNAKTMCPSHSLLVCNVLMFDCAFFFFYLFDQTFNKTLVKA